MRNTACTVTALTNTGGQVVGYLADNPNAEYIQAGLGATANSARNTLRLPGINNFDISVFKNFNFGGDTTRRIQLRADFNRPERVFSSNPRVIQFALRFDF